MFESSARRIVGALAAPRRTFRSIAARPTFLLPVLLFVLVQMGAALVETFSLDMRDYVPKYLADHGRQVSAKQLERIVAGEQRFGWIKVIEGNLVMRPLVLFGITLLLLGAFTVQNVQLGFRRTLAVTAHALLPRVVLALLTAGIVLARGHVTYDELVAGGVVASNPTFFVSGKLSPPLHSLLLNLDVFWIWALFLMTIGFREAGKISTVRAAATVVGLWLLVVGARVLYAAYVG